MTDLIERVKLGDRRKVWITVEPGEYGEYGDTEDAFVRVKAKVQVQVIQVYRYTYQTLRTEPRWFVAEYLWDTAHAYGEPHPKEQVVDGQPRSCRVYAASNRYWPVVVHIAPQHAVTQEAA